MPANHKVDTCQKDMERIVDDLCNIFAFEAQQLVFLDDRTGKKLRVNRAHCQHMVNLDSIIHMHLRLL